MRNGRKVTVLLDGSHHAMRYAHVAKKEDTEKEGFQMWKYMFLNGIFQYIETFQADELIIALDARHNFRKKIFKYYKAKRKSARKKEDKKEGWFNYESFFKMQDEYIKQIEKTFPFKILKIDTTEADDIIGVLCHSKALKDNMKVLVTVDSDYVQLLASPFTTLYNPMTKKFVESDDPKGDLLLKVMVGDSSDYVPSINDRHNYKPEFLQWCVKKGLADNDVNAKIKLDNNETLCIGMELEFEETYPIKAARIMRFPKKEAIGLIESDQVYDFLNKPENKNLKTKFLRNNKLVNLTEQPKDVKNIIMKEYNDYKTVDNMKQLFEFFVFLGANEFLNNTTKIADTIEQLL